MLLPGGVTPDFNWRGWLNFFFFFWGGGGWNYQFQDFFGWENLASNFLGWLDLSSDFWGYSKQSEDSWWFTLMSWPHSSANKVQPNKVEQVMLYNVHVSFNTSWKFLRPGNSAWDFLRFIFWSKDFFFYVGISGFWFLPSFNHPCHLKSMSPGVPPPTPFGMLMLLMVQYPHPKGASMSPT